MIIILLAALVGSIFGIDIGKIDAMKKEAEKAFASGDYQKAAATYQYLADSMGVREDEVLLNLASARYHLADTAGAASVYRELTTSPNRKIRSRSYQQLGVMASKQGKLEEAVSDFKHSLQADPSNQDSRYNYELAARKLAEQRKKEQQQQNKDNKDQQDQDKQNQQQKQKDRQNQEKKNQEQKQKEQQEKQKQQQEQQKKEQEKKEQEKKEQQQQEKKENEQEQKPKQFDPERMKQMKVSEDKARMILDAMKNNEIQYLQQNKRKPTKPKDKNRPDW